LEFEGDFAILYKKKPFLSKRLCRNAILNRKVQENVIFGVEM
jgi:hypothetical protein